MHSLPVKGDQQKEGGVQQHTHVHHVVKHHKRRSLRLGLVPDAYLPYAPVAAEEVV